MWPIKVLQLLYEPRHSGQAIHVLSLVEHLNREKYEFMVACPSDNTRTIEALERAGVTVLPLRMRKLNNVAPAIELTRFLRKEKAQILHVHSQAAGIWGRLTAPLAGVPAVIYTPHTIEFKGAGAAPLWLPLHRVYDLLERTLASVTDVVISVNETDRRRLVERGFASPDKIVTIPNGIDPQRFERQINAEAKKRELGLPPASPLVAQIGRLNQQKEARYFLEAASLVAKRYPQTVFLLVGEGPLRGDLEARAKRLGLGDKVRFLGWRDDVPEILACLGVFVLASLWEGLPYTLLEAMAARVPVVATAVGGNREAIMDRETGFLVSPRNATALAQATIKLLGDRALAKEMGEKGRRRVVERFSLETMITKTEAVYDALIQSKGLKPVTWVKP